jgi:HSP20 family protein
MKNKKDIMIRPGSMSGLSIFGRFDNFFEEMYKRFDDYLKDTDVDVRFFTDLQPKSSMPKINVYETDDNYEVKIAVADFNKDDLELELKDNVLLIKGSKKEDYESDDKKCLVREISSRSFRRVINFTKEVDVDNIKCNYENGIVNCVIGKQKIEDKDSPIKIDID